MRNLLHLLQVTFIVIVTTVLLVWANQRSLETFWQQTYHKPPPWQTLSAHPTWAAGARLQPAAIIAAQHFWQELQGITPEVEEVVAPVQIVTYCPEPAVEPEFIAPIEEYIVLDTQPKTQIKLTKTDRILFAGDSMMQGVAPLLGSSLRKEYGIQSIDLSKQSTGLSYPRSFNWPQTISDTLAANKDIKVVALFLGPNDPWDMPPANKGGKYLRFASPEWESLYRERIQSILANAKEHGADVIWVSPPNMRKKQLSDGVNYLSSLYESEVIAAGEIYLSANDIFKYDSTTYSDYPGDGSGQRVATVKFTEPKKQWHLSSSRVDQADHFPLGGFILQPTQANSALTLGQYSPTDHTYQLCALYQSQGHTALQLSDGKLDLNASKQWQFSTPKTVQLPLAFQADTESGVQLGGWLLEREQPGVMLSALGINGATISMFEKWHSDWQQQLQSLQADLIILAYGTNEAFNDTLDLDEYKQTLTQTIKAIRQHNPNAALLLVGPNDSIKFKQAETCKTQQPVHLRDVINAQREVAQEQQALFWDWQQYMGGDCSVDRWLSQELAQPDKVHLSRAGYERSAKALFEALQHRMSL